MRHGKIFIDAWSVSFQFQLDGLSSVPFPLCVASWHGEIYIAGSGRVLGGFTGDWVQHRAGPAAGRKPTPVGCSAGTAGQNKPIRPCHHATFKQAHHRQLARYGRDSSMDPGENRQRDKPRLSLSRSGWLCCAVCGAPARNSDRDRHRGHGRAVLSTIRYSVRRTESEPHRLRSAQRPGRRTSNSGKHPMRLRRLSAVQFGEPATGRFRRASRPWSVLVPEGQRRPVTPEF